MLSDSAIRVSRTVDDDDAPCANVTGAATGDVDVGGIGDVWDGMDVGDDDCCDGGCGFISHQRALGMPTRVLTAQSACLHRVYRYSD